MDKKEIRKNNFKNYLEKYEMDNIIKSKNILLKKKALLDSIKIEKIWKKSFFSIYIYNNVYI